MTRIPLLFLSFVLGQAAAAPPPDPFDLRVPLDTPGGATWYRFDLPLPVHLRAHDVALRDLRVFNGDGAAVPYSISLAAAEPQDTERVAELRRFPLFAAASGSSLQPAVQVRTGPDGTVIDVHPATSAKPNEVLRGWLLDAGNPVSPMERLQLDWEEAVEGVQRLRLETSNDLQHWDDWGEVQIARVTYDGERIEQRDIPLRPRRARYLRLFWIEPATAPQLLAARAFGHEREKKPPPLTWSDARPGRAGNPGEWLWSLPLALPLERMRLAELADASLAPLQVLGRRSSDQPWSPLARGLVYRLRLPQRTVEQYELALPRTPVRELKVVADPRGGGIGPAPRLAVAVTASRITFLARGNPPFALALGHDRLASEALPLDTLLPPTLASQDAAVATASLRLAELPAAASPGVGTVPPWTLDWKKLALWSILLAGVGLLGTMVWRLRSTR